MSLGQPIKKDLRKKIARLMHEGKSQVEIARMVGLTPATIAHHVRALGFTPKEYSSPLPVKQGKRRCVTCRKMKTLGAYPGKRNAECSVCVRAKKES
jgi:IS30 family transposase